MATEQDVTNGKMGGCPKLPDQAINAHKKNEIRLDLEMAKMVPAAIKHLAKMVKGIDNLKENTQMAVMDKVFKHNKEFMKQYNEALAAASADKPTVEEDEDFSIPLDLSAAPVENKALN